MTTDDEVRVLFKRALFNPDDFDIVWAALVEFVAAWLYDIGGDCEEPARQLAKKWREEMGDG